MTTPSFIAQWAEATRRFVNQAGDVVLQASTQINDEQFSTEKWAKSTQQVVNLALTTVLEMSSMPCLPASADACDLSDFITVEPDDEFPRTLSVARPFVQVGAPSCIIPDRAIIFVPGLIRVHATSFRVGVNWSNLASGTYRGQVRFTQVGAAAPRSIEKDVTIDL